MVEEWRGTNRIGAFKIAAEHARVGGCYAEALVQNGV